MWSLSSNTRNGVGYYEFLSVVDGIYELCLWTSSYSQFNAWIIYDFFLSNSFLSQRRDAQFITYEMRLFFLLLMQMDC